MPIKGVHYYNAKHGSQTIKVGFFYAEILCNLIEDGGEKGMSVRDLRMKTGFAEKTIRNTCNRLVDMNRLRRKNITTRSRLPNYKYFIKMKWLNIL